MTASLSFVRPEVRREDECLVSNVSQLDALWGRVITDRMKVEARNELAAYAPALVALHGAVATTVEAAPALAVLRHLLSPVTKKGARRDRQVACTTCRQVLRVVIVEVRNVAVLFGYFMVLRSCAVAAVIVEGRNVAVLFECFDGMVLRPCVVATVAAECDVFAASDSSCAFVVFAVQGPGEDAFCDVCWPPAERAMAEEVEEAAAETGVVEAAVAVGSEVAAVAGLSKVVSDRKSVV